MTFKDAMTKDLPVFFNADEFAEVALFSRSGLNINIMIDTEPDQITGHYATFVTAKLTDIQGIKPKDTFTVGSDVYRVVSAKVEPLDDLLGTVMVQK